MLPIRVFFFIRRGRGQAQVLFFFFLFYTVERIFIMFFEYGIFRR